MAIYKIYSEENDMAVDGNTLRHGNELLKFITEKIIEET